MAAGAAMALALAVQVCAADAGKVLFETGFDGLAAGKMPDDFLVVDGQFGAKTEGNNTVVELPGSPLESYGFLFGPTRKEDWSVTSRVLGTGKGRKFPTFGLSLNGVNGFKLQVSPAKKQIELFKGETLKGSAPFEWGSGKWTHLRVAVKKAGDGWAIEASAWIEGTPEPASPSIALEEKDAPIAGRSGLWGSPFAGTPIQFDDIKVLSTR